MSNYATLIASIQSVITQNGNNEITGTILQQTLLSMINSLGSGYQFVGIATPETNPGTPDQRVFYLASSGVYPNFGPATIPAGNLAVFYYDTSWHYSLFETTGKFASGQEVKEVSIDETHLTNVPDCSIPTGVDTQLLAQKLRGMTLEETKIPVVTSGEGQNTYDGYINGATGAYASSSYNSFIVVPLGSCNRVRFLAKENSSNSSNLGYAFGTFSGDIDSTLSNFTPLSSSPFATNPLDNQAVEYIKEAPEGATHAVITIWKYKSGGGSAVTLDNFYCYLETGNTVVDFVEENKKEILDITTEIKESLNLLDPSTIRVGYRVNENGSAKTVGSYTQCYGITDYIAIPPEGLIVNHSVKGMLSVVRGCCIYSDKNESSFVASMNAINDGDSRAVNPSGHTGWNYVRFTLYNPSTPYDGVTDGYGVYKGLVLPSIFQPWFEPYNAPKEQQFKTGEKIGSVSIINDPTIGGVHDAASAESVKEINSKINEIDYTEDNVELVLTGEGQNTFSGVVANGAYMSSFYGPFLLIPVDGYKKVKFLAGEKSSNNSRVGMAIGTFSDGPNGTLTGFSYKVKKKYALSDVQRQVEYEVEIPEGYEGLYAAITIWASAGVTTSNFYCTLEKGNTLDDVIDNRIANSETQIKPETSMGSVGNVNIHCAKEHNFNDGTSPILEWFLLEAPMGHFYYSKDLSMKTLLFDFGVSGTSRYYQYGILNNGDIIAVRRADSLPDNTEENPQSDSKRKNPYVWKASENWAITHEVDFGESLKPCGWLSSKGFRNLPDGTTMFGEYTRPVVETSNVWKIDGDPLEPENWHVVKTFSPIGGDGDDMYKHVHYVGVDQFTGTVYCSTGDTNTYSQIWYTKDGGDTWTQVSKNSSLNNGQQFRLCFITFTKDYILWATDTPGTSGSVKHVVYRGERDENGVLDPTTLVMLCDVYDGVGNISSYGQAYLQEHNALFLFDRQDGGGTQSNHLPLFVVDIETGAKHQVADIKGYSTHMGFRTMFKEWYPVNGIIRVGFGYDTDYCNYNKVCGNRAFSTGSDRGQTTVNNLCLVVKKDGDNWSLRFMTYYL